MSNLTLDVSAQLDQLLVFHKEFEEHLYSHLNEKNTWIPKRWHLTFCSTSEQVASHMARICLKPGQDPKTTTRLPGLILASPDLINLCLKANQQRQNFSDLMQNAKEQLPLRAYRKLVSTAVHPKEVSLKQACRQLHVVQSHVEAFSLSWSCREFMSNVITLAEAQKMIKTYLNENLENQAYTLQRLDDVVANGATLYQRRPIGANINVNIKFDDAEVFDNHRIHSPVILSQNDWPRLLSENFPLEPDSQKKQRKTRNDKISGLVQLYEAIPLFYKSND